MNLPLFLAISVFAINTGSMTPTIKPGDLIFVQPKKIYNIGNIVAYKNARVKGITTHRIIAANKNNYITKGDANINPDQNSITKQQIIGKVVLRLPLFGYIAIITNTLIDWI